MNLFPGFRRVTTLAVALAVAAVCFPVAQGALFGPKGDNAEEQRQSVRQQRDQMVAELLKARPEMQTKLAKAAGYATFSQKDVNLFLLASGNGYGLLVDNTAKQETFMRVASLGGGLGLGVKDLRVVFVFNDAAVMRQFLDSGWQFGAKADAAAKYKSTGASAEQNVKANVDFKQGTVAAGSSSDARAGASSASTAAANTATGGPMEIYQFTSSGVALQATVAGTKYWKDSKLNKP